MNCPKISSGHPAWQPGPGCASAGGCSPPCPALAARGTTPGSSDTPAHTEPEQFLYLPVAANYTAMLTLACPGSAGPLPAGVFIPSLLCNSAKNESNWSPFNITNQKKSKFSLDSPGIVYGVGAQQNRTRTGSGAAAGTRHRKIAERPDL